APPGAKKAAATLGPSAAKSKTSLNKVLGEMGRIRLDISPPFGASVIASESCSRSRTESCSTSPTRRELVHAISIRIKYLAARCCSSSSCMRPPARRSQPRGLPPPRRTWTQARMIRLVRILCRRARTTSLDVSKRRRVMTRLPRTGSRQGTRRKMLTSPLTTSRTRAPSHMVTSKATTHRAPAIAKLTKVMREWRAALYRLRNTRIEGVNAAITTIQNDSKDGDGNVVKALVGNPMSTAKRRLVQLAAVDVCHDDTCCPETKLLKDAFKTHPIEAGDTEEPVASAKPKSAKRKGGKTKRKRTK
ncbi:unnamed protein product, partial [Ectocarpus sp. 12 AP-2014]